MAHSNYYTGGRPQQKLSYKEKAADDFKWGKNCIDFFAAGGQLSHVATKSLQKIKEYYDWYNNIIPEKHFRYLSNPFNSDKNQYQHFAARIREYTILRPNIDLLLGENRKRPFVFQVNVHNEDAVNRRRDAENQLILQNLQALFAEEVDPQGREIEMPEQVKKRMSTSYTDQRAIQGQYALDYIVDTLGVKEQLNKAFKDYLIAGYEFTYKAVENGDMVYKRINPVYSTWDTSVDYIEDGEFFACSLGENESGVPVSKVIDMFYEELTEEEVEYLDKLGTSNSHSNFKEWTNHSVNVEHVVWKSFRKVYRVTYIDPITGEQEEMEVDETFKKAEFVRETGIEVVESKSFWIPEVWEGYRIDNSIYKRIRPIPYQQNEMDEPAKCKLPYNGRAYSNDNSEPISVLKLGIPFQILFVATMYNIELLMNKNKGRLLLLDKNTIPTKDGWDEEKFIYFAEAMGYAFIDRQQAGVDKGFNQYQVLDMSTISQVSELLGVIESLQQLWDRTIGVSPQRKGQGITSSSKVGATDNAIFQSSIISEELFGRHDEFVRRELRGLLNVSKHAWREGKKAIHISNDLRNIILDSDPHDYITADYGVTVSNSTADAEAMREMKSMVQPFAQNGQSPTTIMEILNAKNPSKLKEILKNAEEKMMEMAERNAQSEQEAEQQKAMMQETIRRTEHLLDMEKAAFDRDTQVLLKQMDLEAQDANNNQIDDRLEIAKMTMDNVKNQREDQRKRSEAILKAETEKYKADKQVEIAKTNKNKYDV